MTRVAIYARYSCDKQKETSTEDQVRRCYEIISQHGISNDAVTIFADGALSATGKDDSKRLEYQQLIKAWESNKFDVIVVDEWSRLTRNGIEHAQLEARLENNRRVRLISGDGVDTNMPNWQLFTGFAGIVGRQSTRDTRYRVERGMLGQLERGFMIATPAYGYDYKRELDSAGNSVGTYWLINEAEAKIVKEIFTRRANGQSMHTIARWLNEEGVPCSRSARKAEGGFWRASRIRNLLSNSIYRGLFIWHGSTTYRKRAEKLGIEFEEKTFSRPSLRLVSDETWSRCQAKQGTRRTYGSGRHALAGLFTCGCCGGILAISGNKRAPSLACPACASAKTSINDDTRLTVTVATVGAEHMLKEALRHFLTPDFLASFRNSLRQRLMGDSQNIIDDAEASLGQLRRQQDRVSRMLVASEEDDPILAARYEELRCKVKEAEQVLTELLDGRVEVDAEAIEAQLNVDPAELLDHIFNPDDAAPERVRTLLKRLFPSITLEGKNGRYTATFRIQFAAGVALSMATGTAVINDSSQEHYFEVSYRPDNRSGAGGKWSARLLHTAQNYPTNTASFAALLANAENH